MSKEVRMIPLVECNNKYAKSGNNWKVDFEAVPKLGMTLNIILMKLVV